MDERWEKVTREELLDLYVSGYTNGEIAGKFGVTAGKVQYKKKKFDITQVTIFYKKFVSEQNSEMFRKINEDMKKHVVGLDTDLISRAIVHYIFRDGPVEDMHAAGKLSQTDMKTLNKYMNDRVATLIYLLRENDWVRLAMFLDTMKFCGSDWDKPKLQMEELDKTNEAFLNLVIGK